MTPSGRALTNTRAFGDDCSSVGEGVPRRVSADDDAAAADDEPADEGEPAEAAVGDDPRSFLSVRVASPAAEEIYGFGMTYSRWNLKNLTFPVITSEQGVGRGLEPVTTAINAFGGEQGGDWHTTASCGRDDFERFGVGTQ